MNKNGSFIIGLLVAIVAAASAAFAAGTETGREVVKQVYEGAKRLFEGGGGTPPAPPSQINPAEIAYATTNMFHLFRDAQYDYIHRHGGTMARSITELGNGFSIGSFGSLIHEEIWLARFDRPESDYVPTSRQSQVEKNILARPYRYAILPVEDCFGAEADKRTTCILAIPVLPDAQPLLVMMGGPIRSDPQDFYKSYPIHQIFDESIRNAFREAASAGASVNIDKDFFSRSIPGWATTVTNMPSSENKE